MAEHGPWAREGKPAHPHELAAAPRTAWVLHGGRSCSSAPVAVPAAVRTEASAPERVEAAAVHGKEAGARTHADGHAVATAYLAEPVRVPVPPEEPTNLSWQAGKRAQAWVTRRQLEAGLMTATLRELYDARDEPAHAAEAPRIRKGWVWAEEPEPPRLTTTAALRKAVRARWRAYLAERAWKRKRKLPPPKLAPGFKEAAEKRRPAIVRCFRHYLGRANRTLPRRPQKEPAVPDAEPSWGRVVEQLPHGAGKPEVYATADLFSAAETPSTAEGAGPVLPRRSTVWRGGLVVDEEEPQSLAEWLRLVRKDLVALCRSAVRYVRYVWYSHRVWWPEVVVVALVVLVARAAPCRSACGPVLPVAFQDAFSSCHSYARQIARPDDVAPAVRMPWAELEGERCLDAAAMPVHGWCLPLDACCGDACKQTGAEGLCHCPETPDAQCEGWQQSLARASPEDCHFCCGSWSAQRQAQRACLAGCWATPARLEVLAALSAWVGFLGGPARRVGPMFWAILAAVAQGWLALALRACELDCDAAVPACYTRAALGVFLSWDPKPAPRRELAVPRGALALVLVGTGVVLVVAIADPAGSSWLTLAVLVLPPCVAVLTTALARILQTAARRAGLRRAGRSLEPPRPRQVLVAEDGSLAALEALPEPEPELAVPASPAKPDPTWEDFVGTPADPGWPRARLGTLAVLEAPSTRTGRAKDAVRKAALAVEDYVLAPPSDMATDGFITTTTVPFADYPPPARMQEPQPRAPMAVAKPARLGEDAWLQPPTRELAAFMPPELGAPTRITPEQSRRW